MFFQLRKLYSV